MPIKGVSDLVRLPRLGKIRLGIKETSAKTGNPYPKAVDYFVSPDEVKEVYGEKPKELKVMFPTEDDSQWAQQWLRCYSATRGLLCRGDGETAVARVDKATGEIATRETKNMELREISCDPETCSFYEKKQCRRVMNLQFLLPDCKGFGVWQINTSSFFSILNINSNVKFIRGIAGRISMIPLTLKIGPQEVTPEGERKTAWVLTLTAPYSLSEIQKYAQVAPGQALLLPPPDTEVPEDLFPPEILEEGEEEEIQPLEDEEDNERQLIWQGIQRKISSLKIKDSQVGKWFSQQLMVVKLSDFNAASPPEMFTANVLSKFLESLVAYGEGKRQ